MMRNKTIFAVAVFVLFGYSTVYAVDCDKLRERIRAKYDRCSEKCGKTGDAILSGLKDINSSLACQNDCAAQYPSIQQIAQKLNCQNKCSWQDNKNINAWSSDSKACRDSCQEQRDAEQEQAESMCN